MNKHVCPYCEKIHVEPKYIPMEFMGISYEIAGFECPNCGCELLFSEEVSRFLKSISTKERSLSSLR